MRRKEKRRKRKEGRGRGGGMRHSVRQSPAARKNLSKGASASTLFRCKGPKGSFRRENDGEDRRRRRKKERKKNTRENPQILIKFSSMPFPPPYFSCSPAPTRAPAAAPARAPPRAAPAAPPAPMAAAQPPAMAGQRPSMMRDIATTAAGVAAVCRGSDRREITANRTTGFLSLPVPSFSSSFFFQHLSSVVYRATLRRTL